jgi:Tol biopolymer transport system component
MSPRHSPRIGAFTSFALLLTASAAAAQEALTRMSVDSAGAQADGDSAWSRPAVSGDGRYVAFASDADDLVAGDTNGVADVFVHEVATGVTVRVSVDSAGVQGNRDSFSPSLSESGRFVAFTSLANNLIASDTHGLADVFVHDRDPDGNGIFDEGNGVTFRVSIRGAGLEANGASGNPSISANGLLVAFDSSATNLVASDSNNVKDVFLRDWLNQKTTRMSVDSLGVQGNDQSFSPSISRDGGAVGFTSSATNLVAGDGNFQDDVFVRVLAAGTTEIVSVGPLGNPGDNWSAGASLSNDGQFVAFYSWADDLVGGDLNNQGDVFLRDRALGTTERVSVDSAGAEADGYSLLPAVSADGMVVAFESGAGNLVANDGNGLDDVFVRDRAAGTTAAASMNCLGAIGDAYSASPSIASDGRFTAFASYAANFLVSDTNGQGDVFLFDRTVDQNAFWFNYGAGFNGTLGIPNLTASANPVFGATIDVDVDNSLGAATPALLFAGLGRTSIPTSAGGTLLVDFVLMVPIVVAAGGDALSATIPYDLSLCGVAVDLQVLEADAGAAYGISFTPGLELDFGR